LQELEAGGAESLLLLAVVLGKIEAKVVLRVGKLAETKNTAKVPLALDTL